MWMRMRCVNAAVQVSLAIMLSPSRRVGHACYARGCRIATSAARRHHAAGKRVMINRTDVLSSSAVAPCRGNLSRLHATASMSVQQGPTLQL